MKNILFATTALVSTAGIAAADVTFSGKGEAGVYQTKKTAAVAEVAGTANAASWVAGVLTMDGTTTAATSTTLAAAANTVVLETQDLAAAEAALAADGTTTDTLAERDVLDDAVAAAKAALAIANANYAALAGTAAVAAAPAGDMTAYSGYDLNVAVSAETDSGITFAMGFDMGAGHIADQDDDRVMDAQGATIGTSALTITSNGYTYKIGQNKIDDLYDDSQNGDISVSGAMGGLTFNVVHDVDDDVAAVAASTSYVTSATDGADAYTETAAVAHEHNTTSYSFGYAASDAVSLNLTGTSGNDNNESANKLSLSYTVSDTLSLKLGHDSKGEADGITSLSATYAIDALTITASYADDKDHSGNTNNGQKASTNLKVGYTQGAITATFATDESSQWWLNTKYDLGGGASAFATVDHEEFAVAGLSFAF